MVTVRFAPSPTGFLHLGSARTALFNWLYARHTGGKFLLRIEDTDQARSKKEFLDEILEDLKWLGLDWDGEAVYQSQRFDVYREKAEVLLKKNLAYKEGEAIIFKVEKGKTIEMDDIIHGKITFNTDEIKDQVMIKSDGSPAYNFSCVVDDIFQGITHIIRGDDHISNTPKQLLFYQALKTAVPSFAHMPLMMGADGAKLSKRHGAVAVEEYKSEGYLPEALANYLLLFGWSPGKESELVTLEEAVKLFDVNDISDVQGRFDLAKLKWLNGEYIARKNSEELFTLIKKTLASSKVSASGISENNFRRLVELYKTRIKTLTEFLELTDCFFGDNYFVDEKEYKKYFDDLAAKENVRLFSEKLEKISDFFAANIEAACRDFADERKLKAAGIIHPTRVAISGKTKGAGLFEMMELLGKEKTLERMRKASE